jgi:hypothetical protein
VAAQSLAYDFAFKVHMIALLSDGSPVDFLLIAHYRGIFGTLALSPEKQAWISHRVVEILLSIVELNFRLKGLTYIIMTCNSPLERSQVHHML